MISLTGFPTKGRNVDKEAHAGFKVQGSGFRVSGFGFGV